MKEGELRREAWDKMADTWGDDETHPIFDEFYAEFKDKLGKDGLDLGCGKGRYLMPFASDGFNMVGIDQSEEMLKGARAGLQKEGYKAELMQGTSENLDLKGRTFDFVVSVGAIHHNMWDGIDKSFGQVAAALRPGGYFFFQGRSLNDNARDREQIPDHGYTARDIDPEANKPGVIQHYFTKPELDELAAKHGLDVVFAPRESFEPKKDGTQRARLWVAFQKK